MITALDSVFDQASQKQQIIQLVKRQRTNPRNATKKKAEKFLTRHAQDAA